jgi:hypothetical protein
MTNALLTNQSELIARHQANIAASLAHRLDHARATQNAQLLALLEQEKQQLRQNESLQPAFSPIRWGRGFWNRLTEALFQPSQVSIEPMVGSSGAIIWRGFDPRTGETRYAETEGELIDWVEAKVYGLMVDG